MKNLLISLIAALAVITLTSNTASAERTYDRQTDVSRLIIKNTKTGQRLLDKTFARPATTLIKTCTDDARYECVYEVTRKGHEKKLYEYKAAELTMPLYTYEYKVAARD